MPNPPSPLVWYHVILSTYGSWLDGDPRGFRTKNHRKHIEGDYRRPAKPGQYKRRLRRSRQLLVQDPVIFDATWRPIVGKALCAARESRQIEMLAIAVSRQHVHMQIRTPFRQAGYEAGILKNHAAHILRQHGWSGKIWAKRSNPVPIRTREHQIRVFRYILKHELEGAWVWDWKRGAYDEA